MDEFNGHRGALGQKGWGVKGAFRVIFVELADICVVSELLMHHLVGMEKQCGGCGWLDYFFFLWHVVCVYCLTSR